MLLILYLQIHMPILGLRKCRANKKMEQIQFSHWQDESMSAMFPGICFCQLWQSARGAKAVVVKIEPGGKWQGYDVHESGSEEIFVVEGIFNDGDRSYPAGTFIHYPQGSRHVPQSETGCLLFVFYPR